MKIPNINCTIQMTSTLHPSEDSEKVKKAISNIFPYSTVKTDLFSITAQSKELRSFEKIHETIHSKKSQNIYRRYLEKNLDNDTTWFYLNKQAAFVKQIAICEEAEESPLGPIKVILTSSNIDGVIDWIVLGN
ncbi:RNA-binding domain-containing protein [Nitrosopumilus ureiphilus]|uniref:UPF0201 protein C5F50_12530 n=1 Tax=Nitrosopumilus ureiphilus TaxID=1470067 RepID=A0A7D5R4H6_9ARCH|nr:RNA-binding domain-containing protein [Nitrosopumilus ureiphilus]QLH07800.1 hypothetical protein C5F50_12530 [Nitrosopumilus ureiphilus]